MEAGEKTQNGPIFLCKQFFQYHWGGVLSIIIPLIFLPLLFIPSNGKEFSSLYLISVCCFLWITDCIPLYVTALIPIFATPLLGIMDAEKTCMLYFKDTLMMFLGGLMVALAVEYCNLHKRLALKTMLIVGCSPRRLHFGVVFTTTFLSMWISNSATTAMMCPIIKALLEEMESNNVLVIYAEDEAESSTGKKSPSRPALAFYLSAAYASSIGGCGTLIGSGTNLVFKGIYDDRFPDALDKIDFPRFMAWSFVMTFLQASFLFFFFQITHMGLFRPNSNIGKQLGASTEASTTIKASVAQKYKDLGPLSPHEIQVLFWFLLMIILLFTLSPGIFPGWGDVLNMVKIKSSCAVIIAVLGLFLFPMDCTCFNHFKKEGPYPMTREKPLLSWGFVHKNTPWGLCFLLGGGFVLSSGSDESGMSKMISRALFVLSTWDPIAVQLMAIIFAIFLTNFSANVPIANILIPVLIEVALTIKVNPIFLIFPAGIACSMAFHLPVGTPPNAIVSAYANIKTKDMAEGGILPTLTAILLILANSNTIHRLVYSSPTLSNTPTTNI